MSTTAIVVTIIVAAAIVLILGLALAWRARRRAALRSRFGPEYDHIVDNAPNRRAGERELADRAKRRDEIEIRPLAIASAQRYREEWRLVQQRFVDAPADAVAQANSLVTAVMSERGYPTGDAGERDSMLSVDHADVMARYRTAQATERSWRQSGTTDTEELRLAMQHYRSVFDRLVSDADAYPAGSTATSTGAGQVTS